MFEWLRKRRLFNSIEAKPQIVSQFAYYCAHPPRCVAGFKTQPVRMPGFVFDGHASPSELDTGATGVKIEGKEHINPVFWLLCTCGYDSHFVLGHYWRNPDYHNELVFVSPLARDITRCCVRGRLKKAAYFGKK
jgi:hypothetical protein